MGVCGEVSPTFLTVLRPCPDMHSTASVPVRSPQALPVRIQPPWAPSRVVLVSHEGEKFELALSLEAADDRATPQGKLSADGASLMEVSEGEGKPEESRGERV